MMDIKRFTKLVEDMLAKSGGLDVTAQRLSAPAGNLIGQYGPLTDKISKERAIKAASKLWEENRDNQRFLDTLKSISDTVESLGTQTTNSAVMSLGALDFLRSNFDSIMTSVLADVKRDDKRLQGVLLAAMDAGITAGLAFVPVAGPFLAPLSQGVGSALSLGVDAALKGFSVTMPDATKKTVDSGVGNVLTAGFDKDSAIGKLAAQKGLASLVATGVSLLVKRNEESVLKNCNKDTPFTKMMLGQLQTQNQEVATGINKLKGSGLMVPKELRGTSDQTKFYLDEKKTLDDFKTRTNSMYKSYYVFIEKIINLGVVNSFSESLASMHSLPPRTDGVQLKDSQKIALLILGYYHSKDWAGKRPDKQVQISAEKKSVASLEHFQSARKNLVAQLSQPGQERHDQEIIRLKLTLFLTEGEIASKKQNIARLERAKPYQRFWRHTENQTAFQSAHTAFTQATTALSKSDFIRSDPVSAPTLAQMESGAKKYFSALKSALVADITSGMCNATINLNEDQLKEMWKLYIGANLIVNQSLRDAALKIEGKWKKVITWATPKTAATLVDDRYVKMIEEAGYIKRHSENILSRDDKIKLAGDRQLRWRDNISSSPSDAERAMLITFCTIVAFTLDVGKISLGFVSWSQTKKALGDLCFKISMSRVD